MGMYWLDYRFSIFHPQSAISRFFDKAIFVLCPALVLQVFTIGASDRLGWVMWLVAVILNWPLYSVVGLLLAALMKRRKQTITLMA
jgi:hypothetical protein